MKYLVVSGLNKVVVTSFEAAMDWIMTNLNDLDEANIYEADTLKLVKRLQLNCAFSRKA